MLNTLLGSFFSSEAFSVAGLPVACALDRICLQASACVRLCLELKGASMFAAVTHTIKGNCVQISLPSTW